MTDLDQLLRDTLHGRAATITEAPVPAGTASGRRERSPWLLVAATVATVLIAGGGAAVWGLGRGSSPHQSGGSYAQTCRAALPAAWKAAFAGPRFSVDGHDTSVDALTPYGEVVTWVTGGDHQVDHVGLRAPYGTTRMLFTAPVDWSMDLSVDGPDLVLSLGQVSLGVGPNVRDLVAVDLRTSMTRHLLPPAGALRNGVVADRAASVARGVAYWTVIPRGGTPGRTQGDVVAYDLRRNRARVVGHALNLATLPDDVSGVQWPGGHAPRAGVPAEVPSDPGQTYGSVASDSSNYAWIALERPRQVTWLGSRGDERVWTLSDPLVPGRPSVVGVSGPWVFISADEVADPVYYVLDTRTGAMAATAVPSAGAAARDGRIVLGTRAGAQAPATSFTLDTARLPGLHC